MNAKDVVVLTHHGVDLNEAQREQVEQRVRAAFPDMNALVLGDPWEMFIVNADTTTAEKTVCRVNREYEKLGEYEAMRW